MSFKFGGSSEKGKSETIVQTAPASQEETDLKRKQVELTDLQLNRLKQQAAEEASYTQTPQYAAEQEINRLASQRILADLRGELPVLAAPEQARLDQAYGRTEREGEESVRKFVRELAASRGMNMSDSPVAEPALKNLTDFRSNLASSKAEAALNRQTIERDFAERLRQFNQGLQQQQFSNALAFSNATPGLGLQQLMAQDRWQNRTTSGRSSGFGSNWSTGVDGAQIGSAALKAWG